MSFSRAVTLSVLWGGVSTTEAPPVPPIDDEVADGTGRSLRVSCASSMTDGASALQVNGAVCETGPASEGV